MVMTLIIFLFMKIVRYAEGGFDVRTINVLLHAIGMSSVCVT